MLASIDAARFATNLFRRHYQQPIPTEKSVARSLNFATLVFYIDQGVSKFACPPSTLVPLLPFYTVIRLLAWAFKGFRQDRIKTPYRTWWDGEMKSQLDGAIEILSGTDWETV